MTNPIQQFSCKIVGSGGKALQLEMHSWPYSLFAADLVSVQLLILRVGNVFQ